MVITMAFVFESLPFFWELGWFCEAKSMLPKHRKPQNLREKLILHAILSE